MEAEEKNKLNGTACCDCGGRRKHLHSTEDEEYVYEFYKCKECGDIIDVGVPKR
ncbi:MAG TPA: hypothetical protein PK728_01865 [Bacillota bacterium]|nr:hypothetical protein [Bacillota bacterium]